MKFKSSIEINQSRDVVVDLFIKPENLAYWQEGFVKKEPVSGDEGKDGAISKMYYKMGKGELELTETIVSNRLPDTFEAFYHHIHMDNTMKCKFTELGPDKTLYESEYEYTRVAWVMPRLMMMLFH